MISNISRFDKLLSKESLAALVDLPEEKQKEVLSETVSKVFLEYAAFKQKSDPSISGLTMGSAWTVSDVAYLYRLIRDLLLTVDGIHPDTINASLSHALSLTATNADYQAFGSASGLSFIIGAAQVVEAVKHHHFSQAVGDTRGAFMDKVSVIKGVSLAGGGGLFGVFRGFELARLFKVSTDGMNAASPLIALAGTVCYIAFFFFLCVNFGIKIYEGLKLQYKITNVNDKKAIEILQNKLNVDAKEVETKLNEKKGSQAAREYLIQEGYATGVRMMKEMQVALELPELSDEELKKAINKELEVFQGSPEEYLKKIGLDLECEKKAVKKKEKLTRILGAEGVKAIKEGHLDKIKKALHSELTVNVLVFLVCLLGLGVMIASIVLTGGGAALPMAIVALVFGVSMLGVDSYYLYQSYKSEMPAPHDKKMLVLSTVMGIAAFISVIALLGATGGSTMGIFPLVIAIVLLGLWLAQNGATWAVILNKERQMHKVNDNEDQLKNQVRIKELFEKAFKEAIKSKHYQEAVAQVN